jgi:DNA repair exonuclease SbcCD ATPase subunit
MILLIDLLHKKTYLKNIFLGVKNLLIKSIDIEGFKSYTKKQTLDFTKYDKLIFVTGENKIEPELSANGVGKSSLFEAVSWVLFGKTSTNLKAGDVKNWDTNRPCEVTLSFEKNGTTYTLCRTWNPNTLLLNGEVVSQTDLEILIGLNFESFSYSVFISQFGEKFVDFTPSEKMKVFSQIMGKSLTMWDKFSEVSKAKKEDLNDELVKLQLNCSKKSGEISALEGLNYDTLISEFEEEREIELEKLNSEIEKLLKTTTPIHTAKELLEDINITISNLKEKLVSEQDNLSLINDKINTHKSTITNFEFVLKNNTKTIKQLSTLDSICPICLQKTNKELLDEAISNLNKENTQLKQEVSTTQTHLDLLHTGYKSCKAIISDLEKQINTKQSELVNISKKLTELEVLEKNTNTNIARLKQNILDLIDAPNPYIKQKQENSRNIDILRQELLQLENTLLSIKDDFEIYKYWVTGFKEIKLLLTAEALLEFEIEVNNNLQKLGLRDWKVKLDIDSETKSGTVKKGFTVLVQSPLNKSLVPFECWSGGEAQRLRLAISLGLVDFVRNRSIEPCNILIMDEPTQFLSDTGIDDLLIALRDKAMSDGISIFLIDHRNLKTSGVFENMINLIKDENGTIIL